MVFACLFACFVPVETLCQLYKTHGCHRINFVKGSQTVSSWDLSLLTLLDYLLPSSSSMCMKIQDKNANLDMYLLGLYFGTRFPSFWKYTAVHAVGGVPLKKSFWFIWWSSHRWNVMQLWCSPLLIFCLMAIIHSNDCLSQYLSVL